ncbi:MAG: PEP-utilizing enzyme, partial [Phycisphaerae bacterium]|nr:PEP-utilizing enzyme [Phycisphaerae bacterium]
MEIKKGIAVSPGVVIASAVVLESGEYRIPYRTVPDDQESAELEKLREAFDSSVAELNSLREATAQQLGSDIASIFDFHYGVLTQGRLREQIASLIHQQKYSAAYAVREALRAYQRRFLKMQDQLLRERYKDVRDIERRLLRHLVGQQSEDLSQLAGPTILVAHDLTPSQSANLAKTQVVGVAMDVGGLTSHTAIVVRSMGVPAVMGLQNISTSVTTGDTVILDGTKGLIIVGPDEAMLAEY